MPVVDDAKSQWNSSTIRGRVGAFLYSFHIAFVFALVEIGVLVFIPLYTAWSVGILSDVVYTGATLASMLVAITVAGGRTGPSNGWVHWTSPWPEWRAVGRFARNWVQAAREDGLAQLWAFYTVGAGIGGAAAVLILQLSVYPLAVGVAAYIVLFGYTDLYNTSLTNKWFWRRG